MALEGIIKQYLQVTKLQIGLIQANSMKRELGSYRRETLGQPLQG